MEITSVTMGVTAQQHRVAIGCNRPPAHNLKLCKRRHQYSRQHAFANLLALDDIRKESNMVWETIIFAFLLPCLATLVGYGLADMMEEPTFGKQFYSVAAGNFKLQTVI